MGTLKSANPDTYEWLVPLSHERKLSKKKGPLELVMVGEVLKCRYCGLIQTGDNPRHKMDCPNGYKATPLDFEFKL